MKETLIQLDHILKNHKGQRIAAFDLDDTLTRGDSGDAFFLYLKKLEYNSPLRIDKKKIPLDWNEYIGIMKTEGTLQAFCRVVSAMAKIPVSTIIKATEQFYSLTSSVIEFNDIHLKIPVPDQYMQALIKELKNRDFRIIILSASNKYIVNKTASLFFDIPSEDCFAITPLTVKSEYGELLTSELMSPVPVTTGKAEIFHKHVKELPLVTGGNSDTDIHMINMVRPEGLPLWCGSDEAMYFKMKKLIKSKDNFTFIKR